MLNKPPLGLFITGTDTGVGKTYVAALVARELVASGSKVGVYKPVASGCRYDGDQLVADDAVVLWEAAGRPDELSVVCPQRFQAPLAPHLAARDEGRQVDAELLRSGIEYWHDRCDIVLVEGAGGLMSPVSDDDYVADLAMDFGYPLVVVAPNKLGVINQTLQTLIVASTFCDGLNVAGIVLNDSRPPAMNDPSTQTNRCEIEDRCVPPLLGCIGWRATQFAPPVDWLSMARNS